MSTIALAHFANAETKALSQKQEEDIRPRISGYDERLADLEAMGIDVQLVMPPPNQCYYTVPLDIAVPASRMVNDGLAEYVARKPDQFHGARHGAADPWRRSGERARALREVAWNEGGGNSHQCRRPRRFRNRTTPRSGKRRRKLVALVIIHPNGFTEAKRLTRFYFNNVIGNPLETTIALHYLIFDGVLERHPDLKILAVHGGGYLPAYSGRIDHAWGARSDLHGNLPQPPTSYLKKIYFKHGSGLPWTSWRSWCG